MKFVITIYIMEKKGWEKMKKSLKKLMGVTLAVCLTVLPVNMAKASEETLPTEGATTEVPATEAPAETQVPEVNLSNTLVNANGTKVKTMEPHVLTTGTEADFSKASIYMAEVATKSSGSYVKGEFVIPIKIANKGILQLGLEEGFPVGDKTHVYATMYKDAACKKSMNQSTYGFVDIPAKATYYLKLEVTDYNESQASLYPFGISLNFASGVDKVAKNKTWMTAGLTDYKVPIYYKVTVTKPSKITIETDGLSGRQITLCNSKKKAISEEGYSSTILSEKIVYAVPKGSYYVKLTSSGKLLRTKITYASASDASGSTKAKATTLKLNAAAKKGIVTTADKTSKVDWYKFTLTKSSTVNLLFKGDVSSGRINLELYGGGVRGSINASLSKVGADSSTKCQTYTSSKLPKGTYYIKVTKNDAKTSGTYSVAITNK